MTTVYARLQSRRDTAANWTAANPVLAEGEIGFITDTKAAKIGDGVTAWNDLLTRPSQEQLVAVQAAAEQAAADADQRLTATVAAQTATETARDETQALRNQTQTLAGDVASAIVYQNLASIAASKNLTMAAGFVYDTRLDTDRGAWRDRCRATSWYQEVGEFPSRLVGILVAGDGVKLFNGDDPALPLWMEFDPGGTAAWSTFNMISHGTYSAADMKNGKLVVGATSTDGQLTVVDFIADRGVRYHTSPNYGGLYHGNIAQRNAGKGYNTNGSGYPVLVSNATNSVIMAVRPDAPVDPATGLQVPTIAVGTDGGLSVIKHDGTVASPATVPAVKGLGFVGGDIWINANGGYFGFQLVRGPAFDTAVYGERIYTSAQVNGGYPKPKSWSFADSMIGFGDRDIVFRDSIGMSMLHMGTMENSNNFTWPTAMLHEVRSDFVTGWQPGDIRGALLSSTAQTDLIASGELVTNGTFDTDLTGWTTDYDLARGTISWQSGKIRLTNDGTGNTYAYQAIPTEPGKAYILTGDVTSAGNAIGRLQAGDTAGSATFGYKLTASNVTATVTLTFKALSATSYVQFLANGAAGAATDYAEFDNITVQLADADRSIKNIGLIVRGTVPRAPVATGAELAAYGPFSATDYLEQPYNGDLEFGTGDFCVMGWAKSITTKASTQAIIDLGGSSGRGFQLRRTTSGGATYTNSLMPVLTSSTATNYVANGVPGTALLAGEWHLIGMKRKDGVASIIFDDREIFFANNAGDITPTSPQNLLFGTPGNVTSNEMALALWRIGATAPSAAQIAKIYRDEKRLFQENAACTLYGTSDAVTALAHDPVTGLLHAGTSAGRSDFDGLLRVGNTTTPVASAIAASGGMILEG